MIKLFIPDKEEVEGVDYVNITKYSRVSVSSMLSPGCPVVLNTVLGKVGCIRTAMTYVSTSGYPLSLVAKRRLSKKDITEYENNPVRNIPNRKGILAYLLAIRMISDKDMLRMLSELPKDIKFTSFNIKQTVDGPVKEINKDLLDHVNIVSTIFKLIKNNEHNDYNCTKDLIDSFKEDPNKPLFYNVIGVSDYLL